MRAANKQLTILSDSERAALYELPEFNNQQRLEFFTLADKELQLALNRPYLSAQIHCILQIGYFKAVKMFYRLSWNEVDPEDYLFITQQYLLNQPIEENITISKHEYYFQCRAISELFDYNLWNKSYKSLLYTHAQKTLARDINPQFITMELLSHLQTQKIIRPGYTTLQVIISNVVGMERKRLALVLKDNLKTEDKQLLDSLLVEQVRR